MKQWLRMQENFAYFDVAVAWVRHTCSRAAARIVLGFERGQQISR